MHACLAVQDIVERIAQFAEDAHVASPNASHSSPCVALSQPCRNFYEPGCNVRWRHLTKFEPLLRLLPLDPKILRGHRMSPEVRMPH